METSFEDLWFFKFYRQRLTNLEALRSLPAPSTPDFPGSFLPEQFLLVMAGLETLANHWEDLYQITIPRRRNSSKDAERMACFLIEHGDAAVFGRCSIPDLFRRAAQEPEREALISALRQLPGAINPPASMRSWTDDPGLATIAVQPAIVSAIEKAHLDVDWLRKSRYGEILYKEFRCNWIHKFDGPGTRPALFQATEGEPRYDNIDNDRAVVFPLEFLKRTYEAVLSSFAARCFADGKLAV